MMLADACAHPGRLGSSNQGLLASRTAGTHAFFANADVAAQPATTDELLFSMDDQDALHMMTLLDEPDVGFDFSSEWGDAASLINSLVGSADVDMYPRDYEEGSLAPAARVWPQTKPRGCNVEDGVCVMVPAGPITAPGGMGGFVEVCIPASPVTSPRAGSPAGHEAYAAARLTGSKRQRPTDTLVIVSEAAVMQRSTKRPRVPSAPGDSSPASPRVARRRRSPEDLAAVRAAEERATAQMEAMVAAVDPEANARRLEVLAAVKRNGNYDSYVSNAALPIDAIPLQVSLVGTLKSPGLLTALQQTKRKGVTDMYLLEHPRGIPKWCLFFRSCFHRMAKLPRVGPRDPFFEMFRRDVTGDASRAFLAALEACASNDARVAYLAGQLTRLASLLRPDEPEFFLPPAFLAGIAPDASVANCLKIQCQLCGGVQGWRTCRTCYKSRRSPSGAAQKRARCNSGGSRGSCSAPDAPVSVVVVVPTAAPLRRSSSSTSQPSSRAGVTATEPVVPVAAARVAVAPATVVRVPVSPAAVSTQSQPSFGVVLPVSLERLQRVASHRV